MEEGLIDVRMRYARIDEKEMREWGNAQEHYKMNQSQFGNNLSAG
jgi:hypothetical protein